MTPGLPSTLLAIDFGGLMAVVFVVFTVLSWISSAVGNQQKPPRPAGNPPRGGGGRPPQVEAQRQRQPRQERLESEIEAFLQEVVGGREKAQERAAQIEVVEPEPVQRTRQVPPPVPAPAVEQRRKNGGNRKRASSSRDAGGGRERQPAAPAPEVVHTHLAELVQTNDGTNAQSRMDDFLDGGGGAVFDAQPLSRSGSHGAVTPAEIQQLLRSPQGVRQAVLMNEILARPRVLRHRGS